PTDRPRPAVQSFAGGTEMFELPGELSEKVKELSQRRGLTLFMTLLGAYQVLLGRYSGEMDVLVGSPIANRNRSELEGLIGLFVNTLVLRTEMKDNPRVGEMLKRVQEAALEGYAHQDVPFEKLVEELHPQRQMSHSPLFQVMFVLQNAPLPRVKLKGLTTTPVPLDSGTAKFDLTIYLMGGERGLQGWLEYNTDLFEATTIKRMVGHYERLLEGMVRDVEQKIQEIPLLTTGEREQLLVEWNGTEAEYPREKCLQELFEEQVERTPGAVALVCEGYQLTYEQLNARANQLARYLRKLGVRREVCAGLLMERSLEMVVACLGVLKAGGAYVALDPESPVERLAYMLEDSKPVVLLTQEQISRRLSANPVRPVLIDRDWPEIAKQSEANVVAQTTADNLAYVIYTSGSTGKPKGVLGLHNGIVNRLSWMGRNYPFHSDETCCQKTAFSFVDSIAEIFEPLLHGICTVILPNAIVKDPLRLVAELAKNGISRIVLVPSLLRAMLDSHRALQDHLPRLKLWVLSGEALPLDLAARFQEAMPGATLLNLYGSTEVSADATAYEMRAEASRYCVPIGRPIDNMQVFILDGNLVPVPVGIPGEVFVTGAGIARGYLNAPELTAEKFVPNPFGFLAGTRLYKTGDVARSLLDGNIEFLGRSDLQIKIRGFRIEEAEISTALRYHPAVRDVVLATVGDGSTEKQLVAYLVCEAGPRPAIGELRRFLSDKLPGYMIPSHFVMINVFPLLPNGKIDKNGLPSAVLYHNASENPYVPPATETEQTIAAIWRKLLKLEQVGIRDNFFDLGGHSLLMVQVQRELQTLLGKELSVVELFEYPTIKSLSEHLSNGASMHVTALDVQERMDKQKRVLSRKKRQAKPSNEVHE
ncbi:MAG TPA: amino acid adenylation domain-containing protein, partial [Candidatus Angelobacter sp.]